MIENKQQTALEWYDNEIEKLFNQFTIDKINIYEFRTKRFKLIEQAKEMEKEKLKEAWNKGEDCGLGRSNYEFENAEQYYKQTYGGGNK